MGFFSGLTLVLIALKLVGYVTFSWWWVTAPFGVWFIIFVFFTIMVTKYPLFFINRK